MGPQIFKKTLFAVAGGGLPLGHVDPAVGLARTPILVDNAALAEG